jgi:hypothetical protein
MLSLKNLSFVLWGVFVMWLVWPPWFPLWASLAGPYISAAFYPALSFNFWRLWGPCYVVCGPPASAGELVSCWWNQIYCATSTDFLSSSVWEERCQVIWLSHHLPQPQTLAHSFEGESSNNMAPDLVGAPLVALPHRMAPQWQESMQEQEIISQNRKLKRLGIDQACFFITKLS